MSKLTIKQEGSQSLIFIDDKKIDRVYEYHVSDKVGGFPKATISFYPTGKDIEVNNKGGKEINAMDVSINAVLESKVDNDIKKLKDENLKIQEATLEILEQSTKEMEKITALLQNHTLLLYQQHDKLVELRKLGEKAKEEEEEREQMQKKSRIVIIGCFLTIILVELLQYLA